MKLVADENVDRPIIDSLRDAGFEVIAITEVARDASRGAEPDESIERY